MIFQKSVKMSLLFLFLFISFVGDSSAQSTYLKVCEYDQTYEEGTLFGGTTELENRVGIYYNTLDNQFYAIYKTVQDDHRPVKYVNSDISVQKNFINDTSTICSSYGYYKQDTRDHFCFSDDTEYCSKIDSGYKGTSKKIYDINNDVKSVLSSYKYDYEIPDDFDELVKFNFDNVKNEITSDLDKILLEKLKVEINEYTPTSEGIDQVYSFIKNTQAYQEKVVAEANKVKSAYDEKVEETQEDPNTTPEQQEALNSAQDDFSGDLDDYIEKSNDLNVQVPIPDGDTCIAYLGDAAVQGTPAWYLHQIFNIIKYGSIILCLVLTIIEYVKAAASNDDNAIKKASQKTLKRIIITIILFIAPTLIEFILDLLGITGSCMPV